MKFNYVAMSLSILCLLVSRTNSRPAPELAKWVGCGVAGILGGTIAGLKLSDLLGYNDEPEIDPKVLRQLKQQAEINEKLERAADMWGEMFDPSKYGITDADDRPPQEGLTEDSDESDQLSEERALPEDQRKDKEELRRLFDVKKPAENVGNQLADDKKDQVIDDKKDQVAHDDQVTDDKRALPELPEDIRDKIEAAKTKQDKKDQVTDDKKGYAGQDQAVVQKGGYTKVHNVNNLEKWADAAPLRTTVKA